MSGVSAVAIVICAGVALYLLYGLVRGEDL